MKCFCDFIRKLMVLKQIVKIGVKIINFVKKLFGKVIGFVGQVIYGEKMDFLNVILKVVVY